MMRLYVGCLGLVLSAAGFALAEEVVWKAAAPSRGAELPTSSPAGTKDARRVENAIDYGPILSPSSEPPAEPPVHPPKSSVQPLGPPRQLPNDLKSGRPPAPPNDAGLKTLHLVSEQPYGAEPLPIAAGQRFHVRAEFLTWFTKLMNAPPLVTTAPLPGGVILPPNFGQIGAPGTQILYGNGPIGDPLHFGARFSAGLWLDCEQSCGIEASYFFLGRNHETVTFSSPTFPVILRPFIQLNPPGGPNFQIVAFPPGFTQIGLTVPDQTGSVVIDTSSALWGAEFNGKECLCCRASMCDAYRVDVFAGFRYLDLDDRLNIVENITLGANNIAGFPPGTRAVVVDRFGTHNHFYGGQIGARWEYRRGRFVTDGRGSLALGGTQQTIFIDGSQRITPPGLPTQFFTGGLLALPSNIGRHTTGRFSFVPELTLNLGVMATPGVKLFAGYNFLLWTNVARASEQIDPVLDISQIPNFNDPLNPPAPVVPTRPIVPFAQSAFWAQGLQLGIELRW